MSSLLHQSGISSEIQLSYSVGMDTRVLFGHGSFMFIQSPGSWGGHLQLARASSGLAKNAVNSILRMQIS